MTSDKDKDSEVSSTTRGDYAARVGLHLDIDPLLIAFLSLAGALPLKA